MASSIPKYVLEILERTSFEVEHPDYVPGYSIRIRKRTTYTYATSLAYDVERLQKWVERQPGGEMEIISVPTRTRYDDQCAIVTIYDPVMKRIENYIHH